jgi:tRNA pseudouridine55 synthase
VAADGFVVVDKPGGMTSHDVVATVRRLARVRRVGHAGTLDPMATGVLVVGVRLLTYLRRAGKGYAATIRLGQATTTDDAEGEVTAQVLADPVTDPQIRAGLAALTGEIDQVPSTVSAVKVDGRRAYQRARAGEQVTLPARRVVVSRLDIRAVRRERPGLVDVDVELACSSGTYVRAIARDLGAGLGVGGHLTALRRTFVDGFPEAEATTVEELARRAPEVVTLPLAGAARRILPHREVSAEQARTLSHGGPLPATGRAGPYAVFTPAGAVVAVVTERGGQAHPEVVLAPALPAAGARPEPRP